MIDPALAAERQPGEVPALDPVIHAQPRLRVVVALTALGRDDRITFPRLQELLSMTAGNLSTHLRKLDEAGYVTITKTYRRRTPVTYVALSRTGRRAFEDYASGLRALLEPGDHQGGKPARAISVVTSTAGPVARRVAQAATEHQA